MQLIRISADNIENKYRRLFDQAIEIYNDSFSDTRNIERELDLIKNNDKYIFHIAKNEKDTMGMMDSWKFSNDDVTYTEHLAVKEDYKHRLIGFQIMRDYLKYSLDRKS